MGIRDSNIERQWLRKFYPATGMQSVHKVDSGTPEMESVTTHNPNVVEINSLGFYGVAFPTAGDVLRHYEPIPPDIDFDNDVFVHIWYTAGTTTSADTITWKFFYELLAADDTLTATINDALNTVIAADTYGSTTAFKLKRSDAGTLNKQTVKRAPGTTTALSTEKDFWFFEVELDAADVDLSTEKVILLGVELVYLPKLSTEGKSLQRSDYILNPAIAD